MTDDVAGSRDDPSSEGTDSASPERPDSASSERSDSPAESDSRLSPPNDSLTVATEAVADTERDDRTAKAAGENAQQERQPIEPGNPSLENAVFVLLGVLFSLFIIYRTIVIFLG